MPVGFTKQRTREDDDVEEDANGVKDTKTADEVEKGLLEVQLCSLDHQQGYQVAWNMRR